MPRNAPSAALAFATLIALAGLAQAQQKALVGGRLIDGFGGPPLADSVILVENDRIVEVGSVDTLEVPDGYATISTEGMDVLPGIWESHAHLMLVGHADYPHWQRTYGNRYADEIMPAAALQLLLAGVTSARDLGAPLDVSIDIRDSIAQGEIPGPRLFVSGPFLQHETEEWHSHYRWAVQGAHDARNKVNDLADAGVDVIKLIDQDKMSLEEAQAVVDAAHERGLKVVAHSHRPDEIRRGLEIGVDNFEHTGLTTSPEYPEDVMRMLKERTATGRVAGGPLFWTPTVEGLYSYEALVDNPEQLDDPCWQRGLAPDTIADIRQSIAQPGKLGYMQLHPLRAPTLKRKISQLKEAGVVFLVGTDSGVPMNFHCDSTWREMDGLVDIFGLEPMEVIRAATYWPAVMMGVDDEVGTVSPGMAADIIAVKGDVLEHINLLQNVDLVMKAGTVYKQNAQPIEERL
ncbi:MAG: amidohydrolase family protein [Wenzhouxiangellaceae bacterium]|nr:amidohydrolase family protein [Wenzhouxiangellaceae bacterium]